MSPIVLLNVQYYITTNFKKRQVSVYDIILPPMSSNNIRAQSVVQFAFKKSIHQLRQHNTTIISVLSSLNQFKSVH